MRPARLTTVNGYDFSQVKSALQEIIRKGEPRMGIFDPEPQLIISSVQPGRARPPLYHRAEVCGRDEAKSSAGFEILSGYQPNSEKTNQGAAQR